jgi:hypothetical protein
MGRSPQGKKVRGRGCEDGPIAVRSGQKRTRSTRPAQICWRGHNGCQRRVHLKAGGADTGALYALAINLEISQCHPVAETAGDKSFDHRDAAGAADQGSTWRTVSKGDTDNWRSAWTTRRSAP